MNTTDPDDAATAFRPASPAPRGTPRFTPGTMLGDRYRIVALLGSGGMGEVYRAEDTKLGQQVALKFLPHALRSDPVGRERLYAEVRVGRQVSHPNVCRLYDIGEWEGHHFLAMEYVDGEDLASLLRRIGKLPYEKALDIAREICAGVAAAHGLNIVHRDLKPANIMIDGRGQARITDFGLAVVAEDLAARNEIAGTPAYMAPEQVSGGVVTHKADLYALGLILYEIFTGHRLFESVTPSDLASRRSAVRALSSSTQSREIDPAIQRVIARCLEENPEARPPSIHSVIAALPGGDPLQAAIDAGETPSPQMIAAAGAVGEVRPAIAWSVLAASVLGLALVLALFPRTVLFRMVPLPKPPDALVERAQTILAAAGYPEKAHDTSYYFDSDEDYFRTLLRQNKSVDRWKALEGMRPGVFIFGYRQSPEILIPANREGRVTAIDPPLRVPGMTHVQVDAHGRLLSFTAVPPPVLSEAERSKPAEWSKFFEFAGGDIDGLKAVTPRWTAPVDTDHRQAWEGSFRGHPQTRIRIEAASYGGRPVWFRIVGPWAQPYQARPQSAGLPEWMFHLITIGVLVLAVFWARRNLRRGRGDRRTASRLAVAVFFLLSLGFVLRADHVSHPSAEREMVERGVAYSLLFGAQLWVLYLAGEPYVRRRWPHTLIGWSRLFGGRWRDPMIGRDLAMGTCIGIWAQLIVLAAVVAPTWFGLPPAWPISRWVTPLLSVRHVLFTWAIHASEALIAGLTVLLLLLIGLMVLRRRWAAIVMVWLFTAFVGLNDTGDQNILGYSVAMIVATMFVTTLLRYGVLPVSIAFFVMQSIGAAPLTLDPSAWYFPRAMVALLLFVVMIGYGFWASLGEKPAFGLVLEEA